MSIADDSGVVLVRYFRDGRGQCRPESIFLLRKFGHYKKLLQQFYLSKISLGNPKMERGVRGCLQIRVQSVDYSGVVLVRYYITL